MNILTLIKTAVVIMTLMIIAGFTFVFFKITNKPDKIKHQNPVIVSQSLLTFGETPVEISSCGIYLCLLTQGGKTGGRILIIDPERGQLKHILPLERTKKNNP